MKKYEILISDEWYPVRGTTSGMKEGWLQWVDSDGCTGLSAPGRWRSPEPKPKVRKGSKDSKNDLK